MHNTDMIKYARKDAMDRLSNLPDDLMHKILSFISIKDAIGTCVLSSRWTSIWTSMPCLNFENLNHGPHFSKFIYDVLSHRNNQIQVSSVNFLLGREVEDEESVRLILNYTFSQNVQQLSVTRSGRNMLDSPYSFIATPTWDLPLLTTLHLHDVKLSDDNGSLFSKCTNLKNLFLKRCRTKGKKVLNICHPRLTNLTLKHTPMDMEEFEEVVTVVAHQLKNLTIKRCAGRHLINAPGLNSLVIEGHNPWQFFTPTGFHSLDKVFLHMYDAENAYPHEIVFLLRQLHSVKLLTLNLGILQRLYSTKMEYRHGSIKFLSTRFSSSAMESSSRKACAFPNAKILKFWPNKSVSVYVEERAQEKLITSDEIKNHDTSPSAIFPMISREEIIVMGDIESADVYVGQVRRLLKNLKAYRYRNTNKAHMDEHGKPQVEMHWAWELQQNIGKITSLIKLRKTVELEKCRMMLGLRRRYSWRLGTHPVVAWLEEMGAMFERTEGLLTQLSASKRVVLEPIVISLCEDAAFLTNTMLEWMETAKYTQEKRARSI